MKNCFKCSTLKPLTDFYKHAAMGDGRLGKCKECTKSDVNKHRQENLEAIRAYDRLRGGMPHRVKARAEYATTDASKVAHAKASVKYRNQYPERYQARNILNAAVRDGKVFAQPCFVCGDKSEAHHTDYSRPLDVVWLCDQHHKQVHAQHRQYLRAA